MKKIVFVIPYYGKFPSYFQLFLNSCKENSTIDWMIFTDIEDEYQFPINVKRIEYPFDKLRCLIQSKFEFKISLETPYKLCDYKPAYGLIFQEYLADYDYWGYCDVDMILGDLRNFISDLVLREYEKIGHLGHMTLYRNTEEINSIFKEANIDEIYTQKRIFIFDEWGKENINNLFIQRGKRVLFWNEFLDIFPYDDNFKKVITEKRDNRDSVDVHTKRIPIIASYENCNIYEIDLFSRIKKEYAYIHLQKREMDYDNNIFDDGSKFLIIPNQFINCKTVKRNVIIKNMIIHMIFNKSKIKYKWQSLLYWIIEKTGPIRHKLRGYE